MSDLELGALTVEGFCDVLASDSPTPGGGAVGAIEGAAAAALIGMVGRLTIGKAGFEDIEQRMKDAARSYAGVYKRRGHLVPAPCACGAETVEMHHPDYGRPLDVQWTCRPCHLELHQGA